MFLLTYLLLGWLFGSYTVLRWPWLRLRLVLLRLALTAVAILTTAIVVDWSFNLPDSFDLTHRSKLLLVLTLLSGWALLVRLTLRGWVRHHSPEQCWRLMANPAEAPEILREWQRTPFAAPPQLADGATRRAGARP